MGWGGEYNSTYTHKESQDVGHDDIEEIDPNQDDYESKMGEDMDASKSEDEDEEMADGEEDGEGEEGDGGEEDEADEGVLVDGEDIGPESVARQEH